MASIDKETVDFESNDDIDFEAYVDDFLDDDDFGDVDDDDDFPAIDYAEIASDGDLALFKSDDSHVYKIWDKSYKHRFTEFRRLLNEYGKRFIAGYFINDGFFVVAMSNPHPFTYDDQVSGNLGKRYRTLLKDLVLENVDFSKSTVMTFSANDVSSFTPDKYLAIFYADSDEHLLRLAEPCDCFTPSFDDRMVVYSRKQGHSLRDIYPMRIFFDAFVSSPDISGYINSDMSVGFPVDAKNAVSEYLKRVSNFVFVALPKSDCGTIPHMNIVGYRVIDKEEIPVFSSAAIYEDFLRISPPFVVTPLCKDATDCEMYSLYNYIGMLQFDMKAFTKDMDDGKYNNYSEDSMACLKHMVYALMSIIESSYNYVEQHLIAINRAIGIPDNVVTSDDLDDDSVLSNADKLKIIDDARKKLFNIKFSDFYKYMQARIIGHDDSLKTACYYVWSYLRSIAVDDVVRRDNFIIAGGSGCGKTEFMRALKSFVTEELSGINIPVSRIDSSIITTAGFKGVNFDKALYNALYKHSGSSGIGIVFLDEFDKKLLPNHDSEGDNVNGFVQDSLLTALEGADTFVGNSAEGECMVDTRNTLFIAMGTFDALRLKHEENAKSGIGFTSDAGNADDIYWKDITVEDVIEHGAKEELMGRFAGVVNFRPLSDESLRVILRKHIKDRYASDKSTLVSKINISKKAEDRFIVLAKGRRGVREMYSRFDETVRNSLIEIADNDYSDVTSISVMDVNKSKINHRQYNNRLNY